MMKTMFVMSSNGDVAMRVSEVGYSNGLFFFTDGKNKVLSISIRIPHAESKEIGQVNVGDVVLTRKGKLFRCSASEFMSSFSSALSRHSETISRHLRYEK